MNDVEVFEQVKDRCVECTNQLMDTGKCEGVLVIAIDSLNRVHIHACAQGDKVDALLCDGSVLVDFWQSRGVGGLDAALAGVVSSSRGPA